jgi:hypothetical protein
MSDLFTTRNMGRYATRVKIATGAYEGQKGVIVDVPHTGSIMVRLDLPTLPFALGELLREPCGHYLTDTVECPGCQKGAIK